MRGENASCILYQPHPSRQYSPAVCRDPLVGMVKADTPHSFFRWFKKVGAAVLFFYLPAGYSPIS